MDLIPRPGQIVAASANLAQKILYGGVADLRPMPRTLIDEGALREVYHYRPISKVEDSGDPVLLVTPPAVPSRCYDLRRGCSLVEHLVMRGRPTYLVEYGEVAFEGPDHGMEQWVTDIIPEAIRRVSEHAGGRPVHLVGWSLGGILALTAAAGSGLPVASVTTLGAPIDVRRVPEPLERRPFQLSTCNKLVPRALVQLAKLDDTEFLAQVEAVDRLSRNMVAYPVRTIGRLYHPVLRGNELATGSATYGGREIRLADITVPVLSFGGAGDDIAPVGCVRPVEELVPNAVQVRFEIVPGGHLSMLTGRRARHTTWPLIDEFLASHSNAATVEPVIGANPKRRFGSASSRRLSAAPRSRGRDPV